MITKQERKALKTTNKWLENPFAEQESKSKNNPKYRKPKQDKSRQKTFLIDASGSDSY